MNNRSVTTVDFIAKGKSVNEYQMILVEEGPWSGPVEDQLFRIQDRMYNCIDAALDGQLAQRFPESVGKILVIKLDCYNVPRVDVEGFFQRFSEGVFMLEDYQKSLRSNEFVRGIKFEINFDIIH